MKFTSLQIDFTTVLLIYVAGAAIILAIIYYIIKAAVKNGIIDANEIINGKGKLYTKSVVESLPNSAQAELQKKYEKGELSFEEYKKEWDRLR